MPATRRRSFGKLPGGTFPGGTIIGRERHTPMDPIRRTSGPQKPQDVPAATPAAPTGAAAGTFGAAAASAAGAVARPEFTRIAAKINEGISRKLPRDDIMRRVVESEARERFGSLATPQMTESIAETFRSDPALSGLVAKLFAAVA